jgi:hypothetical protein
VIASGVLLFGGFRVIQRVRAKAIDENRLKVIARMDYMFSVEMLDKTNSDECRKYLVKLWRNFGYRFESNNDGIINVYNPLGQLVGIVGKDGYKSAFEIQPFDSNSYYGFKDWQRQ